jgi:hypothetical protein
VYNIFVRKPEEKGSLGKPVRGHQENIKMVDWSFLNEETNQWHFPFHSDRKL